MNAVGRRAPILIPFDRRRPVTAAMRVVDGPECSEYDGVGLRIVVLNDSAPVLKMLCKWLEQHGHHCDTALVADMPQAHEEVGRFIQKHRPDVVIYDVGMPYARQLGSVGGDPDVAGASEAALRYYDRPWAPRPPSRSEGAIPICVDPQSRRSGGGRVRGRARRSGPD